MDTDFLKDLESLVNRHSMENSSNTPDFILAFFLSTCLTAFDAATVRRERWYGRKGGPLAEIPIPEPEGPEEEPIPPDLEDIHGEPNPPYKQSAMGETLSEAHRRAQRVAETLRAERNSGERKLEEAQKEAEHLKFRLKNLRENTRRDNDALYKINEQLRAEVKAAHDAGFVGDDPPGFGEALKRLDAKVHANLGIPSLAKQAQAVVDKLESELKMVREELALEQKGRLSEFERAGRLSKEHMRYREQIDEALGIHPLERRAGFDGALQLLLFRYENIKKERDEAVASEKAYREFVEQIYVRHLLEFAENLTVEQSSPPEMVGGVDHEHVMKIMVKLASASLQERSSAGPQQTGEPQPGVLHEVDRAFYGLTVHQRDKAWLEVERLTQEVNRLRAGKFTADEIHAICHNLHGTVDARAFADGCTAEQRKLYGVAPDADECERLRKCESVEHHEEHHEKEKRWLERHEEVIRERDKLSTEVTAVINTLPQEILVAVREGNGPASVGATLAVSVSKLLEERSRFKTYIIGLEKGAEMTTPRGTVGFVAPDYVQKMILKACKETWEEAIDQAANAVCNYVDGRCNSGRCPCSKVRALTLPEAMES